MKSTKIIVVGSINWDIILFTEQLPSPGEEIRIKKIKEVPGGKGANISIASSRILGYNNVAIFGALGRDNIAKRQVHILTTEGVLTDMLYFTRETPSGRAYIVVDAKGRNNILTYKQANDSLSEKVIYSKNVHKYVNNTNLTIVVDPPFSVADRILSLSKIANKISLWAPGLLSLKGIKNLKTSIMNTDYIIVNESECLNLTGINDPVLASKIILSNIKLEGNVIVTMGENGCLYANKKRIVAIPPAKIENKTNDNNHKILNTAGAGDAFIGTFAAMKLLGNDDIESLISANVSGAIKSTRENIRGSPTLQEILEIKQNQKSSPHIILE
jgi:ribokinase